MSGQNTETKLRYRTEDLLRKVVNRYVIKDKTFKISCPTTLEVVKHVFGHSFSEKELNRIKGHDGYVVLFVEDTERVEGGGWSTKAMKTKSGVTDKRRNYKSQAQETVGLVSEILGTKPILDVWQGLDLNPNIWGDRSMYICCVWGMDESGFTNQVVEKGC